MSLQNAYIGGVKITYEPTDIYADDASEMRGVRVDGQIRVDTAPVAQTDVVRLMDLAASQSVLSTTVEVANIAAPSEISAYNGTSAGNFILAKQTRATGDLTTLYYYDTANSGGANAPYVVAAYISGYWIAIAGYACGQDANFVNDITVIRDASIGRYLTLVGNTIKSSTATCMTVNSNDVTIVGGLVLGENHIYSSTPALAITLAGAGMTLWGDLTLGSNIIKSSTTNTCITLSGADTTITGNLTLGGNTLKSSTGTTIATFSAGNFLVANDLTCVGNKINSSTALAITLSGAAINVAGTLTVTGNQIHSSSDLAIVMSGTHVSIGGNLTLLGNVIKSSSTATAITLSGTEVATAGGLTLGDGKLRAPNGTIGVNIGDTGAMVILSGIVKTTINSFMNSDGVTWCEPTYANINLKGHVIVGGTIDEVDCAELIPFKDNAGSVGTVEDTWLTANIVTVNCTTLNCTTSNSTSFYGSYFDATVSMQTPILYLGGASPTAATELYGPLATAPTVGPGPNNALTEGSLYYNTTDHHFYGYNGSTWKQLDNA